MRTMHHEQDDKHNRGQRKRDPRVVTAKVVRETLRRRFLLLRHFNQPKNPAKRALLQSARHANHRLAVEIERAAAHRVTDLFYDRNRFASQRRFIGGRRAFDH